jgi:hypothetical protein
VQQGLSPGPTLSPNPQSTPSHRFLAPV